MKSGVWAKGILKNSMLTKSFPFQIFAKLRNISFEKIILKTGVLTHRELRGFVCIELQTTPSTRKTIVYSRSFGNKVSGQIELQNILSCYATEFTRKMRRHKMNVALLQIFLSPRTI